MLDDYFQHDAYIKLIAVPWLVELEEFGGVTFGCKEVAQEFCVNLQAFSG